MTVLLVTLLLIWVRMTSWCRLLNGLHPLPMSRSLTCSCGKKFVIVRYSLNGPDRSNWLYLKVVCFERLWSSLSGALSSRNTMSYLPFNFPLSASFGPVSLYSLHRVYCFWISCSLFIHYVHYVHYVLVLRSGIHHLIVCVTLPLLRQSAKMFFLKIKKT